MPGMMIISSLFSCRTFDENMTPWNITINYKVSLFLYLHNDKTKNQLSPNISISNVHMNNADDDIELICHEQDQSQSTSPSKLNIQFIDDPAILHWENHNSFIQVSLRSINT
jgi:hypothetical protein